MNVTLLEAVGNKTLIELNIPGMRMFIRLLHADELGILFYKLEMDRKRKGNFGAPIYKVFTGTKMFVPWINVASLKLFGEIGQAGLIVEEDDGKWDELKDAIRV